MHLMIVPEPNCSGRWLSDLCRSSNHLVVQMELFNRIHLGDCFDVFPFVQDKSVDLVLCDLPYGVTACDWDIELDLDRLWPEYKRILAPRGAVVLTATQPFETKLINSNRRWFRYKWVWEKSRAVGFLNAKLMPLRIHEDILVFAPGRTRYNPQMTEGTPYVRRKGAMQKRSVYREVARTETVNTGTRYPKDIVSFSNTCEQIIHSTQKPVALFEYLIRTYTDEGGVVLDNTSGSGTAAIAALNTGRNFICIEKSLVNWQASVQRIEQHQSEMDL